MCSASAYTYTPLKGLLAACDDPHELLEYEAFTKEVKDGDQ